MSQDTTRCCVRHARDVDQALVEHERLVHWVVHRQWLGELSYVAAVQAGRLALWRAIQGYDPQRGVAFSSYAVPAIRRAVWRAVAEAQLPVREQLRADAGQATVELEAIVTSRLVAAAVRSLVAQLPQRLRTVIVAHYGLAEVPPQTFAAIGQALGVTRQRAQQLHAEALLWLAQPTHSLTLRQLLDRNTTADYRAFLAQQRRWLRRRRSR
jgi:RNA polymerase sigma factor (sigma-70 family)